MAGRIDDVDLDAFVDDGTVLGIDRDPALPLQIIAVHDTVHDLLIGAEDIALTKEGIHQGRFSGIDMGDDGYIDNLFFFAHYCFTSITNSIYHIPKN